MAFSVGVGSRRHRQIAARVDDEILAGKNLRGVEREVPAGLENRLFPAEGRPLRLSPGHRVGLMRGLAGEKSAGFVVHLVVGGGRGFSGADVDVAACYDTQLIAGHDIRCTSVEVLPRNQREIAVSGNDRPDFAAGAQIVAVLAIAHKRFVMALRKRGQVDIPARLQARVFRGGDLRRRKLDVAAGHEGAVALQVAFAHQEVDLRDQHGLGGAVGQRDGLLDQPDEVGGELALLRFGQRRAQLDAVGQRELGAVDDKLGERPR